jgi:hypothetical protein
MFKTVFAKSWMAEHIRNLFRLRPVQLNPSTWACVVRNGQVVIVHRFYKKPGDYEILWSFLRPGQIPSWFKTNMAVRRHWSILKGIASEGLQPLQTEDGQVPSRQVRFGT